MTHLEEMMTAFFAGRWYFDTERKCYANGNAFRHDTQIQTAHCDCTPVLVKGEEIHNFDCSLFVGGRRAA